MKIISLNADSRPIEGPGWRSHCTLMWPSDRPSAFKPYNGGPVLGKRAIEDLSEDSRLESDATSEIFAKLLSPEEGAVERRSPPPAAPRSSKKHAARPQPLVG